MNLIGIKLLGLIPKPNWGKKYIENSAVSIYILTLHSVSSFIIIL